MNSDRTRPYSIESEFKNIDLITPSELMDISVKKINSGILIPPFHNLFTVHRIEKFPGIQKLLIFPHRKPVFDFLYLTNGKAVRYINMDSFEISPNSFFFLPAYQIMTKEEISEDVKGFYCHFDIKIFAQSLINKDFINEFPFLQNNNYPIVKISESKTEDVLNILYRLEKIYRGEKNPDFNLISSYLLTLFLEIKEYVIKDQIHHADSAARITNYYKNILSNYIYKYNQVSEYANLMSITPNYLNRCVITTIGRTARDLLYDMILLEAKVLLKQTTLSISEIAYKLGKNEASDFSRFFKSKTGLTPKEYRQL
jgi:AraC-like DNA-binding protein